MQCRSARGRSNGRRRANAATGEGHQVAAGRQASSSDAQGRMRPMRDCGCRACRSPNDTAERCSAFVLVSACRCENSILHELRTRFDDWHRADPVYPANLSQNICTYCVCRTEISLCTRHPSECLNFCSLEKDHFTQSETDSMLFNPTGRDLHRPVL